MAKTHSDHGSEIMRNSIIRAVIFDLDGTLLDREMSLRSFVPMQYWKFKNRLIPISLEDFFRCFIELDDFGNVWKDKVYQSLIQRFGIDKIDWKELLEDYEKNFQQSCLSYPGTHKALTTLKNRGFKLAVISNGRYPFQLRSVEAIGIFPMLEFVMISEQEGVCKPDGEIFRRALRRLGVNANEAVYVGDHPKNDIQAAKRIGLGTIWRPSAQFYSCSEADEVCKEVAELPEIIGWFGRGS